MNPEYSLAIAEKIIRLGGRMVPKKVRTKNLSVGQFVSEAYNVDGRLLVSQFTVSDQEDIERLQDLGVRVCHVRESTPSTALKIPI